MIHCRSRVFGGCNFLLWRQWGVAVSHLVLCNQYFVYFAVVIKFVNIGYSGLINKEIL